MYVIVTNVRNKHIRSSPSLNLTNAKYVLCFSPFIIWYVKSEKLPPPLHP